MRAFWPTALEQATLQAVADGRAPGQSGMRNGNLEDAMCLLAIIHTLHCVQSLCNCPASCWSRRHFAQSSLSAPIASLRPSNSSTSPTASARTRRSGQDSVRRKCVPPPIRRPARPIRSPRTDSARLSTRWSANTALTSIRPRISPRAASPWIRIPLKEMILPLVVFDATPLIAKDPNHAFSPDDLRAWERKHGRVRKGSFAALRTDMSKDWDSNPERFKRSPFPGLVAGDGQAFGRAARRRRDRP